MSDGLKRCIRYVTYFQARTMLLYLGWGCIYGLVMGFLLEDSAADILQTGIGFFNLLLFVAVMAVQQNFMKTIVHFILAMNCTRKDLIAGYRIMFIEMIAETALLLLLTSCVPGTAYVGAPFRYRLMIYLFSLLLTAAMGILLGIVPPEYALVGRIMIMVAVMMGFSIIGAVTIGPDWSELLEFLTALTHGDESMPVVLGVVIAAVVFGLTILSQALAARRIKRLEVRL